LKAVPTACNNDEVVEAIWGTYSISIRDRKRTLKNEELKPIVQAEVEHPLNNRLHLRNFRYMSPTLTTSS